MEESVMKSHKNRVRTDQLEKLIDDIHSLPAEPIGEHLSDDQFILYSMEMLSKEETQSVDTHLASCEQCAIVMERLIEESKPWQSEEGTQRPAAVTERVFGQPGSEKLCDGDRVQLKVIHYDNKKISRGGVRRIVITGIGVIAPTGSTIEEFWASATNGKSAIRKITRFNSDSYPCQIAGEVPSFDPIDYMDPKTARKLGRFAQFTLAATREAVYDSGVDLTIEDPYRMGVFVATALGEMDSFVNQHLIFVEKGLKRINPFTAIYSTSVAASGVIAHEYNLKGINTTITGYNSGLDAAYLAFNSIRIGDADLVLLGAGESPITPYIHAIFCATGMLSRRNDAPQKSMRPYDSSADGMVLGEGGAALVMEELDHALRRDAKIYGEVISYSGLNEAYHLGIDCDKGLMSQNILHALRRGEIAPEQIDYIHAHANGLLSYDVSETESIKTALAEHAYDVPISSIKPVTGDALSVSGLWQMISSLLTIKHCIIPPTINIERPDPRCDLNYISGASLKKNVDRILVNSHGVGGGLTVLTLGRY
jgi:3-oxoacyl-[acyl-carrier-protein] synthase II